MGVEDLSLDDIIRERKTGKTRPKMYSDQVPRMNQTFQPWNRPYANKFAAKQPAERDYFDARHLIGSHSKEKITDARQKITPKPVADARQKIRARHSLNSKDAFEDRRDGEIPKVTISNDLAYEQRSQPLTFHVTQKMRSRSEEKPRTFAKSGVGIKIAVKNDYAKTETRVKDTLAKKTFERLKITTINKDALRRKSLPMPRSPSPPRPSRPLKKRSMSEYDVGFDEMPDYGKHRRQQRAEVRGEPKYERQQSKSSVASGGDLRPMVSKQPVTTHNPPPSNENDAPVGPSPIEGTKLKVFNLHPVVTEDDILELFSVLGAVRRARLLKPGEAEVVYVRHDNAMAAFKKYNNRDLDGQPMHIKISTSQKPKPAPIYSWMKDIKSSRRGDPGDVTELFGGVLQQALFKGGSTGTSTRPVVFTVKI